MRWLLLAGFIAIAAFCLIPIRSTNLTHASAEWTSTGCFQRGNVFPTTRFAREISAHDRRGTTLWGSWCGADASTGELHSPVFEAPATLELFIAGYRREPGLQLFLEREDNHARYPLPAQQQAAETWVKSQWNLASDLRGRELRLIAIDQAKDVAGWLGVSNPRAVSTAAAFQKQLKLPLLTILIYLSQAALFLLPGFAFAVRRPISAMYAVILVVITGATLGYVSFWAFFFSNALGTAFTLIVYLTSIIALLPPFITFNAIKKTAHLLFEPLLYTALAGLCYICFYFLFNSNPLAPGVAFASDRFFVEMLPGDDVIPKIFADKIYNREPLRPFCCGDWLSSDRPPLESGIILLQRPLPLQIAGDFNYELLGTALQCFWICGVWCLLQALGTPAGRIRQVLGFLIFSGFLFYNSLYLWPKLLSAAFILFLLSIMIAMLRANRTLTNFETAIAAVCLGLALMAHPGSTFSLLIFVVIFARFRHLFSLRKTALACAIVLAFYLPWTAYQKFVDPPGDRLLKMHLAGIVPVDPRSTWQALRDSYRTHTWGEIAAYKWSNITFMAGDKFLDSYGLNGLQFTPWPNINHTATEQSRTAQRFTMWNAVGPLNIAWLAGLYLLLKRPRISFAIPFGGWLIIVALANLVFWSVITFGPTETQTAHSSYADILLISIGLLSFVLTLPRAIYFLLLAWQLLNFWVVWVWSAPARMPQPVALQWPTLILAIGFSLAVVWLSYIRAESSNPRIYPKAKANA